MEPSPTLIQLIRGCELHGLDYQSARYDYVRGKISGQRDESGRIYVSVDSLQLYAETTRASRAPTVTA